MFPSPPTSAAPATQADARRIDREALRQAMEVAIQGDVRFDPISRVLYSTDASVYRIEPIGVVVARSREDLIQAVRICRAFECPLVSFPVK